ncbi:MAG: hypothetical protein QM784_20030 [Polyangiaceae bacterium]
MKSSDVLDVTHEVTAPFDAELVGSFRRAGPNAWDDYEFVRNPTKRATEAGSNVSATHVVHALTPVQFEARGVDVRMRSEGKVVRMRYVPSASALADLQRMAGESFDARLHGALLRRYFEEKHLRLQGQIQGRGAGAVIAEKLSSK